MFRAAAQNPLTAIAIVLKAMGADNLSSISFSGTANNGNFGQSKNIQGPLQMTAITAYTRAIDFTQSASRAFGPTLPPATPGAPPPQPGNFNQVILPANQSWPQQSQIWTTPWGFLKGAAAAGATMREQREGSVVYAVLTWVPTVKAPSGLPYRVIGYINGDTRMVDRVETWVDHPFVGDMHIETFYTNYKDFGGLKAPGNIRQKQAEIETFNATITAATANPANLAELLTPPAPAGGPGAGARAGGPPPPPAVETQQLAPGVFRITGGYISLAVDMGDHAALLESGQSEARALAVLEATRKALPGKPIRYVVNTHAHFDHASGLPAVAAEDIPILTHANNRGYVASALMEQRTLDGDNLSKARGVEPMVDSIDERRTMTGSNGRVIDIYHVQGLEHSDGMLMMHLPAEKILFTADFNMPNPVAAGQAPGAPAPNPAFVTLVNNIDRLKIDFTSFVTVHAPNPDRPITRADVYAQAGRAL